MVTSAYFASLMDSLHDSLIIFEETSLDHSISGIIKRLLTYGYKTATILLILIDKRAIDY